MKTLNDLKKALTSQNLDLDIAHYTENRFIITTSFKDGFDMPTGFNILSFRCETIGDDTVISLSVKF